MEIELRRRIYATFANTAAGLGYSEVHGKIIGCLLITPNPVSLATLAKETGYSASMISLSLDFLENLGMIERVKHHGDRRLFVRTKGDLMQAVKRAVQVKLERSITDSRKEFEAYRREIKGLPDSEQKGLMLERVSVLEKEMKRFERYVRLVGKIRPP
ncbi:MAG: hypothetical protein HYS81_01320 [Candidatus Aenigmatarchaeota archaeon]|nr:MAG: hypothetical protein HYS81_01320 [Candidatus Aenigmarchaeota archaeon]